VKIADLTVKRYSAARDPRADPGGIQVVEAVAAAALVPE